MGRLFLVNLEGKSYSCKHCKTNLALCDDVVSKSFQSRHGKASLFSKVYWLSVGAQPSDPVQRLLFRSGLLPPPPTVAMGRKGGPRDTRPVDPMTGRYVDAENKTVNDNHPKEEDAEDKSA